MRAKSSCDSRYESSHSRYHCGFGRLLAIVFTRDLGGDSGGVGVEAHEEDDQPVELLRSDQRLASTEHDSMMPAA